MPTPALNTTTLTDVAFLIDGSRTVQREDVLVASGQTSSLTPDHRHPPGTVLREKASTGKWYLATDITNGDTGTAATITSSSHTDGNGAIVVVGNHGTISVTTTTGSGTEANNATDLNADADFAAFYTASSGGGELTITSNAKSEEEWFYLDSTTMATAAFAEGVANAVQGVSPKFCVTTTFVELKDINATAKDELVSALSAGNFDESELSSLTLDAKAELIRTGSAFG